MTVWIHKHFAATAVVKHPGHGDQAVHTPQKGPVADRAQAKGEGGGGGGAGGGSEGEAHPSDSAEWKTSTSTTMGQTFTYSKTPVGETMAVVTPSREPGKWIATAEMTKGPLKGSLPSGAKSSSHNSKAEAQRAAYDTARAAEARAGR